MSLLVKLLNYFLKISHRSSLDNRASTILEIILDIVLYCLKNRDNIETIFKTKFETKSRFANREYFLDKIFCQDLARFLLLANIKV